VVNVLPRDQFYSPSYRSLFFGSLPNNLDAVLHDQSPQAMTRAFLTYHITVEGMLAETGYHAIFTACQRRNILPGLAEGVNNVKRDESRHIAYGIYALRRMVSAGPSLMNFVYTECDQLIRTALGIIPEALAYYGDDVPFGIALVEMVTYASDQFDKRMKALERVVP
jgi:ribonucleoside-diphosphate reductase beta chain